MRLALLSLGVVLAQENQPPAAAPAAKPDAPTAAAPVPAAKAALPKIDPRWSRQRVPAPGPAHVIGGYNLGCVQGAQALPVSGPGYELMRPLRRRVFGHPTLVGFVQRLSAQAKAERLGTLAIGDLGLPRGGPTLTGHRSHQTGLDVDIAFVAPTWVGKRRPTIAERNDWEPAAVVDLATSKLMRSWRTFMERALELAARDPVVERIFVNAAIKRELCKKIPAQDGARPAWLRKIRPWWAHHDHFHVRLVCPKGNESCQPQRPLPPGDGCDKGLDWWFSKDAKAGPTPPKDPTTPEAAAAPTMPAACEALVASP